MPDTAALPGLPADLADRLAREAERTGSSPAAIVAAALRAHLGRAAREDAVWQNAPINALIEGVYRAATTMTEVRRHGDFGIGTFNGLDGELVMLDGEIFQLRADGLAYPVPEDTCTPFCSATFFRPYVTETVDHPLDYAGVQTLLDESLPSRNSVFAVRIDGAFDHVRVRSVPPQEDGTPLVEVTRHQPEFTFENVRGTLAGFFTPAFLGSVNVPGWHLHFLLDDRSRGGHLLECRTRSLDLAIQHVPKLEIGLPVSLAYMTADLSRDIASDLEEAEK